MAFVKNFPQYSYLLMQKCYKISKNITRSLRSLKGIIFLFPY